MEAPVDTPFGPHELGAKPPQVYVRVVIRKKQGTSAQISQFDRVAAIVAVGHSLIGFYPYAFE